MEVIKIKKPIQLEPKDVPKQKKFHSNFYPGSSISIDGPCEIVMTYDTDNNQIKLTFIMDRNVFVVVNK